jgi:hypothetical protein
MTGNNGIDGAALAHGDERETLRILRAALDSLPDPKDPARELAPAAVLEGARWIHDWHTMDSELAELTFDSQSDDRELAAVRSTSALRQLTFISGEIEIEIEIEPGEHGVSLSGTVSPVVGGTVQAVVGGVAERGSIDSLGTFVIDNIDHGTVLAFVETDSGTIRLGSFEV